MNLAGVTPEFVLIAPALCLLKHAHWAQIIGTRRKATLRPRGAKEVFTAEELIRI